MRQDGEGVACSGCREGPEIVHILWVLECCGIVLQCDERSIFALVCGEIMGRQEPLPLPADRFPGLGDMRPPAVKSIP